MGYITLSYRMIESCITAGWRSGWCWSHREVCEKEAQTRENSSAATVSLPSLWRLSCIIWLNTSVQWWFSSFFSFIDYSGQTRTTRPLGEWPRYNRLACASMDQHWNLFSFWFKIMTWLWRVNSMFRFLLTTPT